MTTIVTRSGKGSPLTHTEVDTNFTNLNTNKLEAGAIALGSAATPSISFTGYPNTGIYSPGAYQVAVATNGAGRLFVDATGNITQEASSPDLIIKDNQTYTISDGPTLQFQGRGPNATNYNFGFVRGVSSGVNNAGKLELGTNSAGVQGTAITILPGGNVGIGTSAPVNVLELAGNNSAGNGIGNVQGILRVNNNTTAFGSSPTAGIVFATKYRSSPNIPLDGAAIYGGKENTADANKSFFLAFATRAESGNNGNEAMRITSAGLVGIGTSTPGARTEIRQDGSSAVELVRLVNDDTSGAGSTIKFKNFYNSALISSTSNPSFSLGGTLKLQTYNASNTLNTGLVMDNQGRVGIGVTSPGVQLEIAGTASTLLRLDSSNANGASIRLRRGGVDKHYLGSAADFLTSGAVDDTAIRTNANIVFGVNATERARIDSSGRLLVGTSSSIAAGSVTASTLQVSQGASGVGATLYSVANASGPGGILVLGHGRTTAAGLLSSGDTVGQVRFAGGDGGDLETLAAQISVEVDGTPGANDMPGRLVFSTTADGASSPTERLQIKANGALRYTGNGLINATTGYTSAGVAMEAGGALLVTRSSFPPMWVNRLTDDGTLVSFAQDNVAEGTISVSGTTVSYNGAHLSRWSQLPNGAERNNILRGSILSNIDEMCEWIDPPTETVLWAEGDELPEGVSVGDVKEQAKSGGPQANEQLNRMKVSDVEGDKNVSGVFQCWDDDDDTYTNDFYCAMTGDFIIRIAEGVTVERGDLLMSAGDGTAKPQDDDIIRSKTIAKVTSINVSCTYEDGSYCVPCVLMAC